MKKKIFLLLFISLSYLYGNSQSNINLQLFEAVKVNNKTQVATLIKNGANVNSKDKNGTPLLMWATYKGDLSLVKLLVKNGANTKEKGVLWVNKEDYYGNLLAIASHKNKFDILIYYIESCGISVNDNEYNPYENRYNGWPALMYASWIGNLEMVKYLVNKGAIINYSDNQYGFCALTLAVIGNNEKVVKYLIQKGANVNVKSNSDATPLNQAYRLKNNSIIHILKNAGAKQ